MVLLARRNDSAAFQLIEDQRAGHEHGIIERHDAAFENLRARGHVEKAIGQSTNGHGFQPFESDFMLLSWAAIGQGPTKCG